MKCHICKKRIKGTPIIFYISYPVLTLCHNCAEKMKSNIPSINNIKKEICICAAIRTTDGIIIRGHQHRDCRDGAIRRGKQISKRWEDEGFITSQNRFVNRKEAFELMQAVDWQSANKQGYQLCEWLWSEDLY